jgi:beta-lactamase regulating signal transducer with metallopeptidase domain
MVALQWLTQPMCRVLTLTLLHFFWEAIGIAVLLVLTVELCGVRRSASRYAFSLAALFAIAVTPLLTFAFLLFGRVSNQLAAAPTLDFDPSQLIAPRAAWVSWLEAAQPYLLTAWLIGIALFGSRLLIGIVGAARLRRAVLPLPQPLTEIVGQLGRRLQIDASPLVFLSAQATEALAIGLLRPLVLIPAAWAAEMPIALLEAVIAHELAHLRRYDLWVNLVQRIVETFLFYHPAVWWLSRRLRIEREMCADELAVAATGNPLQYAQALEQIAGERQADIRPALAAFLRGETSMRLLQRIQNVLGQQPSESSRMWPVGIVALSLPLGLWAAMAWSGVANAADEREETGKRAVKRDRDDRRTEDRRPEREKRSEEDREEAVISRIGDQLIITRRVDNPRERIEEQERRTVDRERQRVEVEVRDADRGDQGKRRIATAEDKPLIVLTQRRDEERAGSGDRRLDELTAMVKQLVQRVERLQDEVSQLRGQKPAAKGDGQREEVIRNKLSADERSELDARKRELAQAMEKIESARKALAEKEKTLAALAARQDAEVRERVAKDWTEKDVIEKIRAAEEKARATREKGAAAAREKEATTQEQRERALKELERAKQRKEEAAREKKSTEIEELEKKLKRLKESNESTAKQEIDDAQVQIEPKEAVEEQKSLLN